ncbi:hypothetical protein AAG570_008116 [Ranatra chinensis]|uniref:Uncharacterized protein n=1 Tax=Ranatra chinensis TaxID=642074 RepID=A0ABD0XU21_9HEMI
MAFKRRHMFYENKKRETTEIGASYKNEAAAKMFGRPNTPINYIEMNYFYDSDDSNSNDREVEYIIYEPNPASGNESNRSTLVNLGDCSWDAEIEQSIKKNNLIAQPETNEKEEDGENEKDDFLEQIDIVIKYDNISEVKEEKFIKEDSPEYKGAWPTQKLDDAAATSDKSEPNKKEKLDDVATSDMSVPNEKGHDPPFYIPLIRLGVSREGGTCTVGRSGSSTTLHLNKSNPGIIELSSSGYSKRGRSTASGESSEPFIRGLLLEGPGESVGASRALTIPDRQSATTLSLPLLCEMVKEYVANLSFLRVTRADVSFNPPTHTKGLWSVVI